MDKTRTELYELGLDLLQNPNQTRISMLKTQVYNLRTASGFVITTPHEVEELVDFLNSYELN
ncbi:hypothetical protein EMN47_02930 [Prolixibacteraceae bacterium JC049]|nr:hypothetical protein [Prolixibacteraceae bacterium JC049]